MPKASTHKRKAAEETADRVRAAILRGELPPGSDLPGERELSEHLGVSRLTLRSALARLSTEGLVRSVQGSGTRVLDFRESGGVDLIGYLAAQSLEGGHVPLDLLGDLLELRRMLAVELLALVTERATDDELEAIERQLHRVRAATDVPADFMREDLAFARLLVRAGHNLALELLSNTVVRVIDGHPGMVLAFQANAPETATVYGRILELIRERDPARVQAVTRRLLGRMDRVTLDRIALLTGVAEEREVS